MEGAGDFNKVQFGWSCDQNGFETEAGREVKSRETFFFDGRNYSIFIYIYILMANDSAKREKHMMQERGGSIARGRRGWDQWPVQVFALDRSKRQLIPKLQEGKRGLWANAHNP